MTTPPPGGPPPPPPPPPGPPSRSSGVGVPLRPLAAWALVALAGAVILFAFLAAIFPAAPGDFLDRFSVGRFLELPVVVAPLLAALVAARLGPVLPRARLIVQLALAEYAAAVLLGGLAFLITIATRFNDLGSGVYAFGGVLQGLGGMIIDLLWLALLVLAGLWTYQIFSSLGGRLPRLNVQAD